MRFELTAPYKPCGDQPEAIEKLVASLHGGAKFQTLLGVTGSGKTYTMANVIERLQRPVLVVTHNKTLAAQLYAEFKSFFPKSAVEYFVSYFDYYQPEAYIPQTDTYIEKDSAINEEIERLRLSATSSLLQRRDVIVVASVSCIYGLGSPEDYEKMILHLWVGQQMDRRTLLGRLVDMQYSRNDVEFSRGHFRARGDVIELHPANSEEAVRLELFGDNIERITRFEPLTGDAHGTLERVALFPAKHYVTPYDTVQRAIITIREELTQRLQELESQKKLLEAQRLKMRTTYDLEMLQEMGFCNGIENYSRHLTARAPGAPPYTLLDFFRDDYLTILDESHATIPQIGGMFAGDRSRKRVLVEHGFRLPSALDNRPLNFEEFLARQKQVVCVSATPGEWELRQNPAVIEQIIRPTGLTDPEVTVRPLKGQIDDLLGRVRERVARKERVLVTTLTKRTSEDLTDYLRELGVRVRYLHSEIGAIERVDILRGLRKGDFDVLVGINLLREGLDLPEVSLVAILDADKTGFLRSERSLIQTAGRAARHLRGEVILYADQETDAIRAFLHVTRHRREKQIEFNRANHITPRSVVRALEESLAIYEEAHEVEASVIAEAGGDFTISELIHELEDEMERAAGKLEFERAAILRDQVEELKKRGAAGAAKPADTKSVTYRPAGKPPHPKKERKSPSPLTQRRIPVRSR